MKALLKGHRFLSAEEGTQAMMVSFMEMTGKGLQECFQHWDDCWQKCVTTGGNYFKCSVH
jgi:hypothetical protein